jgi:hypothetical protein
MQGQMHIEQVGTRWEYICEVVMYVSGLGGPNTEGLQRDVEELLNEKAAEGGSWR